MSWGASHLRPAGQQHDSIHLVGCGPDKEISRELGMMQVLDSRYRLFHEMVGSRTTRYYYGSVMKALRMEEHHVLIQRSDINCYR